MKSQHVAMLALALAACGGNSSPQESPDAAVAQPPDAAEPLPPDASIDAGVDAGPPPPTGRWTTGDLHLHTIESNDAQVPLVAVLDAAFNKNHLDWIAISNHLRVSNRDDQGTDIASGPLPMSKGIALFEVPAIHMLQAMGMYADKTIFSSVEWDMPAHEHFNVGILAGDGGTELAALNQFEYLFTTRDPAMFDPADVAAWGAQRYNASHADALMALSWLAQNHGERAYGIVTHPKRTPGRYSIADLRELNDTAPGVFFGIEGLVGNQMEQARGGYTSPETPENAASRTYGGCDSVIATLGGEWDALLGEGRRMWTFGDSDFHFRTAQQMFSSGYPPGEYARTYVWVDGDGMPAIVRGLRSGKAFVVSGNLISALDFHVSGPAGAAAEMGGELHAAAGSTVTITIRWKSELPSNYEHPVGSGNVPGAIPVVDHVDLIAGDVGARAQAGTPEYANATNPTTRVLARFAAADFHTDADGYHTVTFTTTAAKDEYFRLRGTNLGADVAGETAAGEPLADPRTNIDDPVTRFDAINDRNYADIWFYSNPVFVKVR